MWWDILSFYLDNTLEEFWNPVFLGLKETFLPLAAENMLFMMNKII